MCICMGIFVSVNVSARMPRARMNVSGHLESIIAFHCWRQGLLWPLSRSAAL